jgi:predicted lipoprotein with Yx(FWY)xxD motif
MRIPTKSLFILPIGAGLLLLAACGGSSTGSTTTGAGSSGSSASSPNTAAAVLKTAMTAPGTVLTTADGKTVYMFEPDKADKSACNGACLAEWPIVAAPNPLPGQPAGVSAKLGVLMRPDGTRQLEIAGRPLYTFAGDKVSGDAKGQKLEAFGGEWYVLAPDGKVIETAGSSGSSSGGYGY